MDMNPKPVSASFAEMAEIVQPSDVNIYGSVFGGHLMSLADKAGGIAAFRHSGMKVVTLSVDRLVFTNPAPPGTVLSVKASVNRVFRTSLEAGILVTGWRPGVSEEIPICSGYITYVAIDGEGEPILVPPVIAETPDQIRRYEEAGMRREARLALTEKMNARR